jgi:hypothetical protein
VRFPSVVGRVLRRVALGIAVLVLLPYAWGPIYSFPDPPPFSGQQFLNPYATLAGTWQRANLHAHGHAWIGITSGEQSDEAVAARYRELGYTIPGISNYHRIAAYEGVDTLPLYEHGFNAGKIHQLAIGAHAVEWFDFPLWQSLSNQQYVIDRVKRKTELISLNHPSSRAAYDPAAVRSLTNYDLIEVVNGPFTAEDVWDAALSSGHAVWAIANDDTHDVNDPRRLAAGWNMIDAPTTSTGDVIAALRAGRAYAVLRTGAIGSSGITTLSSVSMDGRTMHVALNGAPSTITFIGQDGVVLGTHEDTCAADYTFSDADTYVRTVVTSPQTVLYLNPVVRWNGAQLPRPASSVDEGWTWFQRGGLAAASALLLLWMKTRRVETRVAAHEAVSTPRA